MHVVAAPARRTTRRQPIISNRQDRGNEARSVVRQDSHPNYHQLDAALADLRGDHRSGAAELLRRAAGVFTLLLTDQAKVINLTDARRAVVETAVAVIRAQPDIAPLARLADSALEAACRATQTADALRMAEQAAHEFIVRAARSAEQAAAHAADLISDNATVLTHSRSSTVLAAFTQASRAGRRFRVIATESRPLMEGRALAEGLAGESIHVTFIADAAAALMMPQVACVMVGADRVTPNCLVNKIGTRMIALAARECGVKMIALCDTSKFLAAWPALSEANRRRDELWPAAPPQVEVVNRYFEPTPLDYFTGIVTEDGWLAPPEANRRAAHQPISRRLLAALGNA
jgi:translation initiation factor 2B subunit (eIF-2B alpha/beta/delta family)